MSNPRVQQLVDINQRVVTIKKNIIDEKRKEIDILAEDIKKQAAGIMPLNASIKIAKSDSEKKLKAEELKKYIPILQSLSAKGEKIITALTEASVELTQIKTDLSATLPKAFTSVEAKKPAGKPSDQTAKEICGLLKTALTDGMISNMNTTLNAAQEFIELSSVLKTLAGKHKDSVDKAISSSNRVVTSILGTSQTASPAVLFTPAPTKKEEAPAPTTPSKTPSRDGAAG